MYVYTSVTTYSYCRANNHGMSESEDADVLSNQLKSMVDRIMNQHKREVAAHKNRVAEFNSSNAAAKKKAEEEAEKIIKQAQITAQDIVSRAQIEKETLIAAGKQAEASALKRCAEALAQTNHEKAEWEIEKNELAHTQLFEPRIKIDMGGIKYTTSAVTLCRFPESMIGVMFSGRHALPLDSEGYHFIDRDGTHFRHILNFLRDPENFTIELSAAHMAELKREASYYGIFDDMFPFVPAEPCSRPENLSGQGCNIKCTQDENGLWYFEQEPGGGGYYGGQACFKKSPVICCRQCDCGYVKGDKQYVNYTFGLKKFLKNRTIVADNQPECDNDKRKCPSCRSQGSYRVHGDY
jgi:hypothetical protein